MTDEQGKEWLESLLTLMGVPVSVTVGENKIEMAESSTWLTIDETALTPEQMEILIGSRGENIDAVQYLTNTLLNLGVESDKQQAFTVELNGYRQQRRAELLSLAEEVAEKVRQTGEEVEIKSLSAAERRQVHTFLQDAEDLTTQSRGQEPDRRLVVCLRQSDPELS